MPLQQYYSSLKYRKIVKSFFWTFLFLGLFVTSVRSEEEATFLDNIKKEYFSNLLNSNPFTHLGPGKFRPILIENTKGTFLEKVISFYPKVEDFLVYWITDKDALPKLYGLTNKTKELKKYSLISICLLIFSYFLSHRLTRDDGFFVSLFKKILIRFSVLGITLIYFYFYFQKELAPTWSLMKTHLF